MAGAGHSKRFVSSKDFRCSSTAIEDGRVIAGTRPEWRYPRSAAHLPANKSHKACESENRIKQEDTQPSQTCSGEPINASLYVSCFLLVVGVSSQLGSMDDII